MNASAKLLLIFLCLPFFPACQHKMQASMSRISIGMPKEEVISQLGKSYLISNAKILEDGSIFEVIEYKILIPFVGQRRILLAFTNETLTHYKQFQM
jgi:hypothetical protein